MMNYLEIRDALKADAMQANSNYKQYHQWIKDSQLTRARVNFGHRGRTWFNKEDYLLAHKREFRGDIDKKAQYYWTVWCPLVNSFCLVPEIKLDINY